MKKPYQIIQTDRGWEIADENGVLNSIADSPAYPSKIVAEKAAEDSLFQVRGFDELRASELRCDGQ